MKTYKVTMRKAYVATMRIDDDANPWVEVFDIFYFPNRKLILDEIVDIEELEE